jgi:murein DD-endopeptidase MepM/ murein hydrolase activator NlpD
MTNEIKAQDGISFLGNTLALAGQNNAQQTLQGASQSISAINSLNAKSVDTSINALVQNNLNRAQQLQGQANPFQQLGQGLVKGAATYYEQKQDKLDKKLQEAKQNVTIQKQEEADARRVANAASEATQIKRFEETLRDFNTNRKWKTEGGSGFITAIETKLKTDANLNPDAFASILSRAYRTVSEYESAEQKQAGEALTKIQDAVFEQKKVAYAGKALLITEKLKAATNIEQGRAFEDLFGQQIIAPIMNDPQLTEYQKLSVAAKVGEQFNAAYEAKVGRYETTQSAYRQWAAAQPQYQAAYLKFSQTNDQLALQGELNAINLQFPLAKDFTLPPGEALRRNNQLAQSQLDRAKLTEQEREAFPLQLSSASVRYFAATALLDRSQLPAIKAELANDKLFSQVELILQEYDDLNSKKGELSVEFARTNTEIAQLNLSTTEDFYKLAISARKSNNPQQLNVLQTALSLSNTLTPEQKNQLLTSPEDARNNAEIRQAISQLATTQRQGINQIIKNKRAELQTKNDALSSRYPNLVNFGLFNADAKVLQRYRTVGKDVAAQEIKAYQETLLQRRQQLNLNQSLNGQTPNFNQEATRASSITNPAVLGRVRFNVDGRNKEVLVSPIGNNGKFVGAITDTFRWRDKHPVTGERKFHSGLDIGAPLGTPVASVTSGVVFKTKPISGYGNIITVKGDDGLFYRYAHSKPAKQVGDRVNAGDVVAHIDGSGQGTGAHLHFEVRTQYADGKSTFAINPVDQLRKLTAYKAEDTGNLRGLRQDTSAMSRQKTSAQKPLVMVGNGAVLTNRIGNITPAGTENAMRRLTPTTRYEGARIQTIFTKNKPVTRTTIPTTVPSAFRNDPNNNYNYVYLAQNPQFRQKLNRIADELGTSGQFLADIISQESKFTPNLIYNKGRNVGITGFGRDSGVGKINDIVRLSAVEQLDILKKYISVNIKPELRKDIRTLWAGIRMGTILRNRVFANPNRYPYLSDTKKNYADELKMLGRDAGREYLLPGYDKRSSSLKPNTQIAYGWGKSTLDAQLQRQGISNIVISDV